MTEKNSISQWQQAHDLFESYIDKPIEESIAHIENDDSITAEVKKLVLRLLHSLSSEATLIEQTDLSFFDTLNASNIDLSHTNLGEYHLLCQIGKGGMAQVYKAERINTSIQKFVAVKILPKGHKLSKVLENLFKKEQLTLSKLTHPHIISFHHGGLANVGTNNETAYLVMEYIEKAEDVRKHCKKNKFNTTAIVRLLLPIIDAIGYAHQQLIVHKDIKPSNVLIDQHGKPYLLDFGISSIANQKQIADLPYIYTPDYASPEQFLKEKITTSSDVFSFVAMLLELITGKKRTSTIDKKHYDYLDDKRDYDKILSTSKLDTDLKNIIQKGLQEKPHNRYQSTQELKLDLQNWLKSEPVSATPKTSIYLLKKFINRNRLSSLLVSLLVVAIVFSVVAMFVQMNNATFEAKKSKQVTDFLIESIQSSDPDLTKGKEVSVKELLNNAKLKIQESSLEDSLLSSSLQQNIGAALAKIGQYAEAENLLLKAIESNPNNRDARLSLAQLYLQQKAYKKSIQQYNTLKQNKNKLNQQQNIQLQQLNAEQLLFKGQFKEAIEVVENIINTQNTDSKQNIKNYLLLANILDKKGNSQKAVGVLEKALAMSDKVNGALSTSSTTISNLLADAMSNINPTPYDKLLNIYQQTIKKQIQLYGEKHPLVAKTYLQYGFALKATGKIEQAQEVANIARMIAVDNFGENHILTAHIDLLLSQIQLAENNIDAAISTLKKVLVTYENTYGAQHFETNQVKTTLALYLIRAKQAQAAIRILLTLYESQTEQLGKNHQATLYVVLNLLKAYNLIGNYSSAIAFGEQALLTSQKSLGNEFPITIGLQATLGESHIGMHNPSRAIALFTPLLEMNTVKNNPAYDKKISALLIQAYSDKQQFDQANHLIKQIKSRYYADRKADDYFRNLEKLQH